MRLPESFLTREANILGCTCTPRAICLQLKQPEIAQH